MSLSTLFFLEQNKKTKTTLIILLFIQFLNLNVTEIIYLKEQYIV
jgi:hypothetical protein